MSLEDKIVSAVETYVASFETKDLDTIVGLFAEDAWIEDPVGTGRKVGHKALREFYQFGIEMGAKGSLESEIRVVGNEAAFAFSMAVDIDNGKFVTRPIDLMTFNDEGKIISMRAFWGSRNQSMEY
jgi:steroid delta-isomerase